MQPYLNFNITWWYSTKSLILTTLCRKLRTRDATKFHVQLSIALFFMLLVFIIGIDRVPPEYAYGGCVTVSALIQYFSLVAFMWMGAEALLMFQKLVIVFIQITTKYIIAVSLVCWCKSRILIIILCNTINLPPPPPPPPTYAHLQWYLFCQ